MFDYRQLYNNKDAVSWFVQEYTAGMSHIARLTNGGELAAVRADLGLTGLERVVVTNDIVTQYLYAQDPAGKQFFLPFSGDIKTAWADAMQLGLDVITGWPGKTFATLRDAALTVYASILTKISADDQIFIGGHGLGGAVAAIVAQMLKDAGKKIAQCYQIGAVQFVTADMVSHFTVPCWAMGFPEDELSWAPPSALAFGNWWANGVPAMAELWPAGTLMNWNRNGRARVALNDLLEVQDPLGWPSRIPQAMIDAHASDYYVRFMRRVTFNSELNRSRLGELINTLNANFGMQLPALGAG